jgi:cupin superfamily acireductone dioxygenase involved in methionine salvage
LLKVESSKTTALDQELATVLVGVLDTTVAAIEDDHVQEMDVVRVFLASPFFDQLIAQWAAEHEPDADDVKQLVRDRVLAIHYRAQDVTEEQLADLVRVILRSLEP